MPQASDIVVNNGAGSPVAKTFSLISPSAGDGGLAQWALKEGTISAVFPSLTAMAGKTGNNSRKLTIKFRLPSSYTDSVSGLTMVSSSAEMNVTFSVPNSFPESLKADYVAFSTNILSSVLVKSMIRDAYPAT